MYVERFKAGVPWCRRSSLIFLVSWFLFAWQSCERAAKGWTQVAKRRKIKKNLWDQGSLGWRRRIKDVHMGSWMSTLTPPLLVCVAADSFPLSGRVEIEQANEKRASKGARLGWAKKLRRSREGVSKKGGGLTPSPYCLFCHSFARERLEKERKWLLRRLLLYGSKSVAHPHSAHLHHWPEYT